MLGYRSKGSVSLIMMPLIYLKSWVSSNDVMLLLLYYLMLKLIIELTPHIAAEAFYTGELEAELRRICSVNYYFKYDSDREKCMEMIESKRRKMIYPHPQADCFADCKSRGIIKLLYQQ